MKKYNWEMKEQENNLWRRVVCSPTPLYIFNGKSVKHLVEFGTIVIAGGGGGIPAFNDENNILHGLDAVIDKDYAAAKLGRILHAEELWIITDVDNVYLSFGTDNQEILRIITTSDAEKLYNKGEFQQGSIGPKIKAALHFLKYHGEKVIITSIPCIQNALEGNAGTEIRNEA